MKYVGVVRYQDQADTDRTFSWFSGVDDLTKFTTFCTAVAPMIGATLTKIGVTQYEFVNIPGTGSPFVDVFQRLQVTMYDADGNKYGIALPAPAKDLFEVVNGVYRLKKTYGDQIAQYYSNLIGVTVTFKAGALVGPQPDA